MFDDLISIYIFQFPNFIMTFLLFKSEDTFLDTLPP